MLRSIHGAGGTLPSLADDTRAHIWFDHEIAATVDEFSGRSSASVHWHIPMLRSVPLGRWAQPSLGTREANAQ